MYELTTSTGHRTQTSTVESVASALAHQLHISDGRGDFSWTVTTPHHTVLSDSITAAHSAARRAAGIEHAYGVLVRDHLAHAAADQTNGLLLTTRH